MSMRWIAAVLAPLALAAIIGATIGRRATAQGVMIRLAPGATDVLPRPGGTATIVNQSDVGLRADAVGPLVVAPPPGFDILIGRVDGPGAAACRRVATQFSVTVVCDEAPAGDLRLAVTVPTERMPLEAGCTEMRLPGFGGDLPALAALVRPAAALESLWSRYHLRAYLVGGGESYQFLWRGYVPEGDRSEVWSVPTSIGPITPSLLFICMKEAGEFVRPAGR